MAALPITIFSDFSCPYSYVTEMALRGLADLPIEVRFRAFELFPPEAELPAAGPPEPAPDLADLARRGGIDLHPRAFTPRTRKAHEAVRFARALEAEPEMREAVFHAYWRDGRDIGRVDVLTELAAGVGLGAEDLRIALDIDRHAEEVAADLHTARRLRLPGTPTTYLGTGAAAVVMVGARDAAAFRRAIQEIDRNSAETRNDV